MLDLSFAKGKKGTEVSADTSIGVHRGIMPVIEKNILNSPFHILHRVCNIVQENQVVPPPHVYRCEHVTP